MSRRCAGLALAGITLIGGIGGFAASPVARAAPASSASVIAWGDNSSGQRKVPPGLTDVVAVSAGGLHNLALKADRTVVAWGENGKGQASVPPGLSGVTAISAGGLHSLAIADKKVVAWGDNSHGEATVPAGLPDVTAVAAGYGFSVALTSQHTVVAWGDNRREQATVPAGLSDVTAIAAGYDHALALKSDGTVVAWGRWGDIAGYGGPGKATAIAAGDAYVLVLLSDGTLEAWGDNPFATTLPSNVSGVVAISGGLYHCLALKSDGTVVTWGYNRYGQARPPAHLGDVRAVSAGAFHSLVLGTIWSPSQAAKVRGKPVVDATLTADPATSSDPQVTLAHQWYRVPAKGKATAIGGATAPTYTPVPADVGNRLKVVITWSRPGFAPVTKTSANTAKVKKANFSPTPPPVIDNTTPAVDQKLTADPGTWGPDPVALTYQWYRAKKAIKGETTASHVVRASEVGSKLRVAVTGTKPGYNTKSVFSAWTKKVVKATFAAAPPPKIGIAGTPRVGKVMTAEVGAWSPMPTTFAYQWFRDGTKIAGATKSAYTLPATALAHSFTVQVTGSRPGYVSVTPARSDPVGPVEAGLGAIVPVLDNTTPQVGGDVRITQATDVWRWIAPDGLSYDYMWFRVSPKGVATETGMHAAGYYVWPGDVGYRMYLEVTGWSGDYAAVTVRSAMTAAVRSAEFTTKPVPTITTDGTPQVGETVTAEPGVWLLPPDNLAYQWYRSGVAIAGADAKTYTLAPSDLGRTMTVKVTATRDGYVTASMTSAATTAVAAA